MISYSVTEIKKMILSSLTCIEFTYHKKYGNIDPFPPDHYHILFDGVESDAKSIDEVMSGLFFDGKSLQDIGPEINDFSW